MIDRIELEALCDRRLEPALDAEVVRQLHETLLQLAGSAGEGRVAEGRGLEAGQGPRDGPQLVELGAAVLLVPFAVAPAPALAALDRGRDSRQHQLYLRRGPASERQHGRPAHGVLLVGRRRVVPQRSM